AAEDRGGHLLDGPAAGGPADTCDAGGRGGGAVPEGGDPIGEGAQPALDVRTTHVLPAGGGAHTGQGGAGTAPPRGALPVEVGQQRHAVRPGDGGQSQSGELLVVHAQQGACGLQDAGGVDGGGHRQEAAGGVGEPGDRAARVVGASLGDHRAHTGRA